MSGPMFRRHGVGRRLAETLIASVRSGCASGGECRDPACGALLGSAGVHAGPARRPHAHAALARRLIVPALCRDCLAVLSAPAVTGRLSGLRGQADPAPSRTVRPDHRAYRLRCVLRQRGEARPPGTGGEAGDRRRRRARRGHRRLLCRAHLRRAQRDADVQGAEGVPGRCRDPAELRKIRRRRRARSAR